MTNEHQPSWELYRTFLHVIREGSLSAASRSLRVAQPTVRRRISSLEAALGGPLFSRSPNGLVPTDAALRILPLAHTMEATARSLVRVASAEADAVRGVVRIAASELVGVELLPTVLRDLHRQHPELTVELVLSNQIADIPRRDADIALRMAPPSGESLVARRLGTLTLGFFASETYLSGRQNPEVLADLLDHDLVGYDNNPQLIEGLTALGLPVSPRDFRVRTDHDLAYLSAVRSGLGIGVTYVTLAHTPPLVRLLPDLTMPVDLWLVAHQDLRQIRRIRVVLDHLAAALQRHTDPCLITTAPEHQVALHTDRPPEHTGG
ncbi:MAG: LysR family transcriptional regulator [Myxococcota bacterium]